MFEWRLSSIAVVKEKNYRFSDSWTSISDIGKVYNNKLFTYQEYLKTENSYINLFISIFNYIFLLYNLILNHYHVIHK